MNFFWKKYCYCCDLLLSQLGKTGWQNPLTIWFSQEYTNKQWRGYWKGASAKSKTTATLSVNLQHGTKITKQFNMSQKTKNLPSLWRFTATWFPSCLKCGSLRSCFSLLFWFAYLWLGFLTFQLEHMLRHFNISKTSHNDIGLVLCVSVYVFVYMWTYMYICIICTCFYDLAMTKQLTWRCLSLKFLAWNLLFLHDSFYLSREKV